MRSKYVSPTPTTRSTLSLCNPPTRYLDCPASESKLWPPMDTQRMAAERQAQPATTSQPPSHNSHLHNHA